jgi:lipopolysaccharide/colanic/teichoic acid biosynthesis glycosyltransferase
MTSVQEENSNETNDINDHTYIGLARDRALFYFLKRLVDIVFSLVVLIVLSPLFLLIGLVIALYSPGPVFFLQERVGARRVKRAGQLVWKRETFKCYKFRTMTVNADTAIHEAYVRALIENDHDKMAELQGEKTEVRKLVKDSRVTAPGKILRKLSLDELPQFINVLIGEMSVVGPRPAIPYEVDMYKPWHLRRLEAQPGITGLQQVTARSTADFDQQVRLDIDYVERQSFWLDTTIILKTPFVILSARGAE